MMSETETAPRTATDTETVNEMGALATIDESYTVQLCKVIRMDHCGAGDRSQTQGGCSVLARATERNSRDVDQPFGIRNKKKQYNLHGDTDGEWPSGCQKC